MIAHFTPWHIAIDLSEWHSIHFSVWEHCRLLVSLNNNPKPVLVYMQISGVKAVTMRQIILMFVRNTISSPATAAAACNQTRRLSMEWTYWIDEYDANGKKTTNPYRRETNAWKMSFCLTSLSAIDLCVVLACHSAVKFRRIFTIDEQFHNAFDWAKNSDAIGARDTRMCFICVFVLLLFVSTARA